MDAEKRLEVIFSKFPGIGPRQAKRFIYYLVSKPDSFVEDFLKLVRDVKKTINECDSCHRFFTGNGKFCGICIDKSRDQFLLMIVSRDSDLENIEKSGVYRGLYFVLGGIVPILENEPGRMIRLSELNKRLNADKNIKEVILSLDTTPEGDHTSNLLKKEIQANNSDKTITVMGRGLSTGAELEYADSDTIRNAFLARGKG